MPEAIWFKLCRLSRLFQHSVVALLGFGRRDVADGLQEPPVVEPVHPFQRRELDGLEAAPWSAPMDHLGLVETARPLELVPAAPAAIAGTLVSRNG